MIVPFDIRVLTTLSFTRTNVSYDLVFRFDVWSDVASS